MDQHLAGTNKPYLERLYAERQAARPTEGNRTRGALGLAILMVVTLFVALFSLVWVQRSEISFLRSLSGVAIIPPDALTWTVTRDGEERYRGDDLFRYVHGAGEQVVMTTKIPVALWSAVVSDQRVPLVLALPAMRFERALIQLGGKDVRTYFASEPLAATFAADGVELHDLDVKVVITPNKGELALLGSTKDTALTFVALQPRYQKYTDLIAAKRSGAGKQLADIARIVLAVLSLFLFIFVDSSPECLGLAVFMGAKAIAVTLAQNWLPDAWVASQFATDLKSFLLCFGDIMQLYFFIQLARLAKPVLKPWFVYGGTIALAYAAATHYNWKTWDIDWNSHIWRWRNVSIGVLCMAAALAQARYCFANGLKTRGAALVIATSGTIVQIVYPLMSLFPAIFQTDLFQSLYHAFEMHTPYVFALSTFINISTLERRVKSLSHELAAAKDIEREMALGQAAQQPYADVPKLPQGLAVALEHKPARYVSGDVTFVHWDEPRRSLTMILTDVTGEGVQAALKASICSALADAIWADQKVRLTDESASRIAIYDLRLHTYLSRIAQQEEILSIVGGEYLVDANICRMYRVNGVYPIVVAPEGHADERRWKVQPVPLKNRASTDFGMPHGGFVLHMSDGLVGSSRGMADFCRYLSSAVERAAMDDYTEAHLKALVLEYPRFTTAQDDRTLMVFHCADPNRAATPSRNVAA